MVASWGFVFPIPLGRQEAVGEPRRDGDSTLTFVVGEAGGLVPVEKGLGPRLGVGGGGNWSLGNMPDSHPTRGRSGSCDGSSLKDQSSCTCFIEFD